MNDSWVWRGITHGLNIIRDNHCWKIGTGENVFIWRDIWVPGCFGYCLPLSSLMLLKLLTNLFIQILFLILILSLSFSRLEYLCMRKTKSYGLKLGTGTLLISRLITPSWTITKMVLKMLKLTSLGRDCGVWTFHLKFYTCPLCGSSSETIQHIFNECQVTYTIWFVLESILFSPVINSTFSDLISSCFNANNFNCVTYQKSLRFICFSMWTMWKYRCSIVFDRVIMNPQEVINLTHKNIFDWENFVSNNIISQIQQPDFLNVGNVQQMDGKK